MKPIIIAEAGVNHNGNFGLALKMVDAAKEAGADYIKFQTFKSEKLVTASGITADYQKRNCREDSQLDMLRKLELSFEQFREISDYCKEKGIGFLSTPFDFDSITFLASLGMDYMKVPSGEITNLPYLRQVAATGIPVIISTGMCDVEDIEKGLHPFYSAGYDSDRITLLHCTTEYPAPLEEVNLRAIVSMRERFGLPAGYSDHTQGIEVSLGAAALGASVIEKHFTLSRSMTGPDHQASLEPDELRELVKGVRDISLALGNGIKVITASERKNISVARKSIVASRKIKKGEILTEENLTVKRPASGISPMKWDEVIGTVASRDYEEDDMIVAESQ